MVTREQVVAEARRWVGTRYQHQAHIRGIATDCGGMVYGVGRALGLLPDVSELPEAEIFRGYAKQASNGSLLQACGLLLSPADSPQPGDVFLMQFNREPQHVGIFGDYQSGPAGALSIIHAYAPVRSVVESRLDESFRRRVIAVFSYPGIES